MVNVGQASLPPPPPPLLLVPVCLSPPLPMMGSWRTHAPMDGAHMQREPGTPGRP